MNVRLWLRMLKARIYYAYRHSIRSGEPKLFMQYWNDPAWENDYHETTWQTCNEHNKAEFECNDCYWSKTCISAYLLGEGCQDYMQEVA